MQKTGLYKYKGRVFEEKRIFFSPLACTVCGSVATHEFGVILLVDFKHGGVHTMRFNQKHAAGGLIGCWMCEHVRNHTREAK